MKYLLHGEESERLRFRNIHEDDFEEWLVFHQDPASRKHWTAKYLNPELECKKWYERQFYRYQNKLGGHNALIEKSTNQLVGHCGLLLQTVDGREELEIGYSLLPKFWNKGYASEAAKRCRDFAFENNLSESLISIISLTNVPSQKVAKKNGMQIAKTSTYNFNEVYIFKIEKQKWLELSKMD